MGGHEEQVAAAMTAFFAQQFSAVPKMDPLNPNEYDPEASNKSYKPTLEYVDNPFADNKMPPGEYIFSEEQRSITLDFKVFRHQSYNLN